MKKDTQQNMATLIGKKINHLAIVAYVGYRNGKSIVTAVCECGMVKDYIATSVITGRSKSCGCLQVKKATKHGLKNHPLYRVWNSMIQRCVDKNYHRYADYGGKGVSVSLRWLHDFKAFFDWAIDKWKPGLQLDKDIRSGAQVGNLYCPELCCFVTQKENARRKSNNVTICYDGKTLCAAEWAEKLNLPAQVILARIHRGWDAVKTLTTPVKKQVRHEYQ